MVWYNNEVNQKLVHVTNSLMVSQWKNVRINFITVLHLFNIIKQIYRITILVYFQPMTYKLSIS